jgi:hypothetical protein
MTAVDLYEKFMRSGRKEASCTFSYKLSLQSVRTSLYRIQRQEGETFRLKTNDLTLTIYDE